jgi:hypothetical protein
LKDNKYNFSFFFTWKKNVVLIICESCTSTEKVNYKNMNISLCICIYDDDILRDIYFLHSYLIVLLIKTFQLRYERYTKLEIDTEIYRKPVWKLTLKFIENLLIWYHENSLQIGIYIYSCRFIVVKIYLEVKRCQFPINTSADSMGNQ